MSRLSRVKKATTVASTFAIALAIGFIMQYGDADAARYTSDSESVVRDPVLIVDYSPLTRKTDFTPKPITHSTRQIAVGPQVIVDPDSVKLIALVEEFSGAANGVVPGQRKPSAVLQKSCDIVAATAPDSTGSVMMQVVSECRPEMPFTVSQSGMTFSAATDLSGTAMFSMPALTAEATFFITFEDGKSLAVSTYVPAADNYNRIVFQWEGHPGEYLIGDANDVRLDRYGTDIGEIPRFAEVYSFPSNADIADGLNRINVVAEVTEYNCEQDLIAESFSVFPGVDLMFKDIRITLPDCQQVGELIELKKVLGEQTIATR